MNTSSILGLDVDDCIPIYSSLKSAIVGFGRGMGTKHHYENNKVKIITVCPGITMTKILRTEKFHKIKHHELYNGLIKKYKSQQ